MINIDDFFNEIKAQRGISALWQKVLYMLKDFQPSVSDELLDFFAIYFSLLDDGNICIPLEKEKLFSKWSEKWEGLLLVSEKQSELCNENFKNVINYGIEEILNKKSCEFVEILEDNKSYTSADLQKLSKPFVLKKIDRDYWLFAAKYFAAKIEIEERIKVLFPEKNKPDDFDQKLKSVVQYYENNTEISDSKNGICLNHKQATAVVLGQEKNLIITGGPGTGKTTAVCYLLWEIFKNHPEYCNYNLYLAAPSGKAAERMKESISDSLKDFKENIVKENQLIFDKLTQTDSSTIHRLLSYNPATNGFNYNKDNQFERNSIFVIDEASMIDIQLFKNLMEAIPEGARIFILGDKDQLPSVQAGAVLGELLGNKEDSVVALVESKRFNEDSEVGRLKNEIQRDSDFCDDMSAFGKWLNNSEDFKFAERTKEDKENPVFFYELKEPDKANGIQKKGEQISALIGKWGQTFCNDLSKAAMLPEKNNLNNEELKNIWKLSIEAKILCAERDGIKGVTRINEEISKAVCESNKIKADDDGYFEGQVLMLSKNQKMFRLYNGDCGVVVSFENDEMKYFMIEKKASAEEQEGTAFENDNEISGIFRKGDFLFYPLHIMPKDSVETAYAITIHKSQGSGYNNIMVFLPEQKGHPLLNRQIFYTAITRTKGNTYIIASRNAMNYAKRTIINRFTMIKF